MWSNREEEETRSMKQRKQIGPGMCDVWIALLFICTRIVAHGMTRYGPERKSSKQVYIEKRHNASPGNIHYFSRETGPEWKNEKKGGGMKKVQNSAANAPFIFPVVWSTLAEEVVQCKREEQTSS